MQRIPVVLGALLFCGSANAACALHAGATFVGAAVYQTIDRKTKATVDEDVVSVTSTLNQNGNGGTLILRGKSLVHGVYTIRGNFTVKSFDPVACTGTANTDTGQLYQVTIAASGTIVTLVDITPGPTVRVGTLRLEQV